MGSNLNMISMDQCRDLEDLRNRIENANDKGMVSMVLWNGRPILLGVSGEDAKESLCRSVIQRWAANPEAVGELLEKMQDEEPEDWCL